MDIPTELPQPGLNEIETAVISQQFGEWNKLIQARGKQEMEWDDSDGLRYSFTIDRSEDPDSKFTSERIDVHKPNIPLEDYIFAPVVDQEAREQFPQSKEGEEWILLRCKPENIYRPRIYRDPDAGASNEYRVAALRFYISSLGKAYQAIQWELLDEADITDELAAELPQVESKSVGENGASDKNGWMESPVPFDSKNLEKLKFILSKATTNEQRQEVRLIK